MEKRVFTIDEIDSILMGIAQEEFGYETCISRVVNGEDDTLVIEIEEVL